MTMRNDLDNVTVRENIASQLEKMSSLLEELGEHFDREDALSPECEEGQRWRERRATVMNAARQLRYAAREVRP